MALPKMQGDAPLIRAAMASLATYMPGQVALFNAEPANQVEIEEPQSYWFGGQPLLTPYPFPQVEVASVTGDTGNWAIGRTEVDHNPRMNVALWVQGDIGDAPALYEQTLGLRRCAIECLVPPNAFGPGVEIAQRQGITWRMDGVPFDPTAKSPSEARDFQLWRGTALIQFRLEAVEHFT